MGGVSCVSGAPGLAGKTEAPVTIQPIAPLRQRMIEGMTIRRFKERRQDFYQRAVAKYAQHFPTSLGELNYEHVRQYRLRLAQSGMKPGTVNQTISALRFFCTVTMAWHDALEMIRLVRAPEKRCGGRAIEVFERGAKPEPGRALLNLNGATHHDHEEKTDLFTALPRRSTTVSLPLVSKLIQKLQKPTNHRVQIPTVRALAHGLLH
jgi:Phage integrase, N-terminal SAM-like domain